MQTVLKVAGSLFIALALATLAACGGGGGDSPAVPAVAPLITSQPANATVTEGTTAQFSVAATGTAPLTYQWRRNGAAIAGATAPAFVTPALTLADNSTQYSVVVSNTVGSVTSATAGLTVNAGVAELSLLAGTSSGSGYFDGPSASARFGSPYAVAFDATGNAYVSDVGNRIIRKIDAAGLVSTLAGSPGLFGQQDGAPGTARFSLPRGLTVDASGVVYVADWGNGAIRRISPAGIVSTMPTLNGSDAPTSVAMDGVDLLITDNGNQTINRLTPAGVVTTVVGQVGTAGTTDGMGAGASLTSPWAIVAAGAGRFIVLERSNPARIRLLQGASVTTLATFPGVSMAEGLAVDAAGNVYVTSAMTHAVYRWDQATGVITVVAGSAGNSGSVNAAGAQARFTRPRGLAFRSPGELVIADTGNRSLRTLSLATQTVTTFGGSQRVPGLINGNGAVARFNSPTAIRADVDGNLLVVEFDNRAIRRVDAAGNVSTLRASGTEMSGLGIESTGSVLVGRPDISIVERILPSGVTEVFAGVPNQSGTADGPRATAQFGTPLSVAIDSTGGVYVGDGDGTIRFISASGTVSTFSGLAGDFTVVDGPRLSARFVYPYEIALDGLGNIYILDSASHAVRKIDTAGTVSILAGSHTDAGYVDGPAMSARFNAPIGLAIDASNTVYVAESSNHTIRKITPSGIVSTVVGSPGVGTFQYGPLPGRLAFPGSIAIAGRTLYIAHEDGVSRVTHVP